MAQNTDSMEKLCDAIVFIHSKLLQVFPQFTLIKSVGMDSVY